METDLFHKETTYLDDYGIPKLGKRACAAWSRDREEKQGRATKVALSTDIETLQGRPMERAIPFTFFLKPKPITGTCPYDKIVMVEKPVDTAVKIRPRVILSPAVSLDDAERLLKDDPKSRGLLTRNTYLTCYQKAAKEAALPVIPRKCWDYVYEPVADRVQIQQDVWKPIPSGWVTAANAWDGVQNRALSDPTRTFWLCKDPPVRCGACVNPFHGLVSLETKELIKRLVKEDKLVYPFDILPTTYAGFQPLEPLNIPMEKINYPPVDPRITINQAVTSRLNVKRTH